MIALAGLVLAIERLRQRLPRAYLPISLLVIAALAAAAYLYGGWPARVALGTTIILLAFGISITLGHLAFLDAYALLITPGGLDTPSFTPEQIEEIFRARRQTPPRLPDVPANALLWARLTSPGLGEPGGPLQRRIAEIYSRDEPPFYKGFLRLDTTSDEVTITLHEVFGNLPATDRASSEAALGTETAGFHRPHTLTHGQGRGERDRCHGHRSRGGRRRHSRRKQSVG